MRYYNINLKNIIMENINYNDFYKFLLICFFFLHLNTIMTITENDTEKYIEQKKIFKNL